MQLTVWCILFCWKLRLPQVIKKFPTFCGMWRFITLFTTNHHWSLYWANCIQFTPSQPVFKMYFSIIFLSMPVYSKQSLFFSFAHQKPITKNQSALLFCTTHATHIHTLPIPSSLVSTWLLIQSLFLTVQCPPTSCYFRPIRFEYFLW
jgi:hypothetical protein